MFRKILMMCFILCTCTAYSFADEFRLKQINLDMNSSLDNQIKNTYGNLWITYQLSEEKYQLFGSVWTPVTLIEVYYKRENNFIYIGKIDIQGIYDKNNNLICKNVLLAEDFDGYTPLGLTEESLEDPFYTAQYLLNDENDFGGLDPYATITINFETNSLEVLKINK